MASNKVNMKKGKDEKGKGSRGPDLVEDDDLDHAMLRKPIQTSVTGFGQARKIFDDATEEVKDLLAHECDILYECKVCRNIFRSLANFLCHKRLYCIDTFNRLNHGHFVSTTSLGEELRKIQKAEEMHQASCQEKRDGGDDDEDYRIPITKDITAVMEKIQQRKGIHRGQVGWQELQLSLQKIPGSSAAVFQNSAMEEDDDQSNTMRNEVLELDKITSTNRAVLQRDGKFTTESSKRDVGEAPEEAIPVSDDDDHDGLVCKICNRQFSTMKTLRFHLRQKHVEARLVFPCPECLDIFSTSWSVFRHLFKVHRKSAAQIRRLRESIQAKAFRMNNPPPFYERRKLNARVPTAQPISEEERLDQESQAWMESMESDGCAPRCGGCGRAFERRAALLAHTHTCLRRHRDRDRIQIQVRRDYPKPNCTQRTLNNAGVEMAEITQAKDEDKKPEAETITIDNNDEESSDKTTMDKEKEDANVPNTLEETKLTPGDKLRNALKALQIKHTVKPVKKSEQTENNKTNENTTEKSKTNENTTEKIKTNENTTEKINSNDITTEKIKSNENTTETQTTTNPTIESEKPISKLVSTQTKRFTCKLCNYKDVYYEKLIEHLRVVHKMKGDNDFYSTTIKSSEPSDGLDTEVDEGEGSPESRRASRCSSDSSRLSDEPVVNASSSNRNSRRKRTRPTMYTAAKRKRDDDDISDEIKDGKLTMNNVIRAIFGESDSAINDNKIADDHSSELDADDMEDKEYEKPRKIQEKPVKRNIESTSTSVSRRPVRNRAKPKRADFEYDLSNLLKMDAQGYRDQNCTPTIVKPSPPPSRQYTGQMKKKPQSDSQSNSSNESIKECAGALLTMSKKSDEVSAAHIRPTDLSLYNTADQITCKFIRAPFPRHNRQEKSSPRKQKLECYKDAEYKLNRYPEIKSDIKKVIDTREAPSPDENLDLTYNSEENWLQEVAKIEGLEKSSNLSRASLEAMKKKSFAELSKGMKTKILVIKPINKNKDGNTANSSLKFQRIKLNPIDKSLLAKVPSISKVNSSECNQSNGDLIPESDSTEQAIDKVSSNNSEMLVEDYQIPNNSTSNDVGTDDVLLEECVTENYVKESPVELDEMEIIEEVVQ